MPVRETTGFQGIRRSVWAETPNLAEWSGQASPPAPLGRVKGGESISRRVAALIEEGVKPSRIVAFAFTVRAAEGLKTRTSGRVAEVEGNQAIYQWRGS